MPRRSEETAAVILRTDYFVCGEEDELKQI
jgi:hypothetical protein